MAAKKLAKGKRMKENTGYLVKQYGATCGECHRKMGQGTEGVVVRHGLSSFYYHPSCFKRREANQYLGHMI